MNLTDVYRAAPPRRKKFPVGRGESSGLGKTAGRGYKGQKSRSGTSFKPWFEGGQMPLVRKLPKRGFTNAPFKVRYAIVNVGRLGKLFKENETVDMQVLIDRRILSKPWDGLKILGEGEISIPLTVKANATSGKAREKIEKAGGKVELLRQS